MGLAGCSATPTGSSSRTSRLGKYVAAGCVGLLVLAVCGCVALGVMEAGVLLHVSQEPENLIVSYSMPDHVELGEEFELILTLTNTGSSEILIGDIDFDEPLGDSILDGATVIGTDPQMERNDPLPGFRSFHYGRTIPAGEQRVAAFRLRATTPGQYFGSIEVYVGDLAKNVDNMWITVAPPR